jgi:geranylgeranyl diphosphate synthase type I
MTKVTMLNAKMHAKTDPKTDAELDDPVRRIPRQLADADQDLAAVLDHYTALVQSELARAWSGATDPLTEMIQYATVAPGKMFRSILLLESALAVGGRLDHVLPAAVGTECGHVASLTHDDIIDGDETRRGRPAVHRRYGMDNAILTGDALIFELFLRLAACRHRGVTGDRVANALEVVAAAGVKVCRGQVLEAEITSRGYCEIDAYREMAALKTAALFDGACRSGAILAGGSDECSDALGAYGHELGIAFQMRDDLLPYLGDQGLAGKPAASDVRNRRLTLPVLLALQMAEVVDRAELSDLLGLAMPGAASPRDAGAADVAADQATDVVRAVLHRSGALERAMEMARSHAAQARAALEPLPASASRRRLEDFTHRVVERLH